MSNMSYCRNENTSQDLSDVWDNWDLDMDDASLYELYGRSRLLKLIKEISENVDFDDELENINIAIDKAREREMI